MRNIILLVLFLSGNLIWSQEKDSIVEDNITGNIFKPKKIETTDDRIAALSLPRGFHIERYAENLGSPRIIAVSPDGNVYVTRREGDVILLKDTNKDGKADDLNTVVEKEGAHGIAFQGDMFYLVTVNEVYRTEMNDDGSLGELEEIITDLPDGGQHSNRTIGFSPDGMMYISVGSTCNACEESREESAAMLRSDGNGRYLEVFATGLRNTVGFDWHPETNELFGMDHGIDWLGDDEQKEELNLLTEGADYGWPYIYDDGQFNIAIEPEEMSWEAYAERTTNPEMLFTAHSAPMEFRFYRGDQFPSEYKNSALVVFRGSWNRKPASGYKIMRVDFEDGRPVNSEDFVTGFLTEDGTSQFARLVGLAELPDGSVLVSDDDNGMIYRIYYQE